MSRYRVRGWVGDCMMTTIYNVPKALDAREAARMDGMTVVDVLDLGTLPSPQAVPVAPPKAERRDSPLLCFGLGVLIPLVGLIVALVKWRDDRDAGCACLIGSIVGFLLWSALTGT